VKLVSHIPGHQAVVRVVLLHEVAQLLLLSTAVGIPVHTATADSSNRRQPRGSQLKTCGHNPAKHPGTTCI